MGLGKGIMRDLMKEGALFYCPKCGHLRTETRCWMCEQDVIHDEIRAWLQQTYKGLHVFSEWSWNHYIPKAYTVLECDVRKYLRLAWRGEIRV